MVQRVHGGVITDQMLTGSQRFIRITGPAGAFTNAVADGNQRAASATVADGGTGYIVGDVGLNLTATGGTGTAAQFEILTVEDGEVKSVKVDPANDGDYSVLPTNPVTTTDAATGSGATVNVEYSSLIIIPNYTQGDGSLLYVPYNDPVPGSAADQLCEAIAQKANIVQIAVKSSTVLEVAVENTSFGWETITGGSNPTDLELALEALGTVDVPDTTPTGGTVNLSSLTVAEITFTGWT